MKSIKSITFLFLLIGIGFCIFSCKGLKSYGEISLIQTDLKRYNLKESIKRIDGYYLRNFPDSLPKEKILDIVFRNDCQIQTLNITFDSLGFFTKRNFSFDSLGVLDITAIKFSNGSGSKKFLDYSDLSSKKKIRGKGLQDFPCYNPNKVLPNDIVESNNPNQHTSLVKLYHEYKYKTGINGRIKEIREYMNGTPIKYSEFDLDITRHNTYSKNNLLVCQNLILKEKQKNRLFESVNLHGMDVPVDAKVHYEFNYDSLERLTNAQLFQNNKVIWSETYAYRDTSMRPFTLDRFIIASRTFGKHLTNNTTEWFNQYGDIIKSVNYDRESNVVRTRFYEYDYDKHNNWTQCRMYLMGGSEKTDKPTLVANRKIEYYPSDKKKDN